MATFTTSKHTLGGPTPCLCPSAAGSHCGFSETQPQVCPWALATLVWLILWLRYWSVILSFVIFWSGKHQGPRNLHLKSSVSCCLHYSGPQKHFPGCLDLIADSLVVICFVVLCCLFVLVIYLFHWVFFVCRLSLVAVSGGYSLLWWLLLLWRMGSKRRASVSCSTWAR